MTRAEFFAAICDREFHFTRTCLASQYVSDNERVVPTDPQEYGSHGSIRFRSIHCYDDTDLFTEDCGVFVAVVSTGAGHLWCDRLVPRAPSNDHRHTSAQLDDMADRVRRG